MEHYCYVRNLFYFCVFLLSYLTGPKHEAKVQEKGPDSGAKNLVRNQTPKKCSGIPHKPDWDQKCAEFHFRLSFGQTEILDSAKHALDFSSLVV